MTVSEQEVGEHEEKVLNVIRDYVKPNRTHLLTVERIYENVTGDEGDFTNFDDVEGAFVAIEWNDEKLHNFVDQVKQVVEKGENRVPETYFDIIEPDQLSTSKIKQELAEPEYTPDAEGEDRDGFVYEVGENGNIRGRYIYTDITTKLTFNGELQPTMSDGFIEFEIDPEQALLIINSTSVIDVQKSKKYFGNKTSLDLAPSADYTTHTEGAIDRINDFLAEFHDGIPSDGEEVPGLLQVDEIKMEDTSAGSNENDEDEDGKQLENIQFEGHDIKNDDEVQSYLGEDSDWVIKKLEAEVYYNGDNFKVTIGASSMMSYAKVSDSTNYKASTELSEIVRNWFLEDLRVRNL